MKVKLIASIAGVNFSYAAGQTAEVDPATGASWIKFGLAVAAEAAPETATVKHKTRKAVKP